MFTLIQFRGKIYLGSWFKEMESVMAEGEWRQEKQAAVMDRAGKIIWED